MRHPPLTRMISCNLMLDDGDDDYVQPGSPEAQRFRDGAALVCCRLCAVLVLLPLGSDVRDCGTHEPWRVWFSPN